MDIIENILKRIISSIPTLIGITILVFIIFHVVAGNPAAVILGKHATKEEIEILNHQLGLDKPLLEQYLQVLKSTFTFDFGRSWVSNQKISSLIISGFGVSILLAICAITVSTLVTFTLTIIDTLYQNSLFSKLLPYLCTGLMSISYVSLIIFLQWLLAYKIKLFPISGYSHRFPVSLHYLILPSLVWTFSTLGIDIKLYRSVIRNEYSKNYILTARSMGLSEYDILRRHILPNVKIPIITNIIIQLPVILTQGVVTESFFGLPGLGKLVYEGIMFLDFPIIKAMTIISALIYLLLNIVLDIAYLFLDPRLRK